jgi:hypothetical protein
MRKSQALQFVVESNVSKYFQGPQKSLLYQIIRRLGASEVPRHAIKRRQMSNASRSNCLDRFVQHTSKDRPYSVQSLAVCNLFPHSCSSEGIKEPLAVISANRGMLTLKV